MTDYLPIRTKIPPSQFLRRTSQPVYAHKVAAIAAGMFGKDAAEKFMDELYSEGRSEYTIPISYPA